MPARRAIATSRPASPSAAIASRAAARPTLPSDEIVGRRVVVRAAPAGAGRDSVRHDDHGGHVFDAEQPEQARVDGNPGVGPAEAGADALHRFAQPAFAHAAQHKRRAGIRGIPRPLAPARGRHRKAGEDQDFRRPGTRSGELTGMAFGREGRGFPGSAGNGLPPHFAHAFEGAFEDRPRPLAEIAVPRLTQHFGRKVARGAFRRNSRFGGTGFLCRCRPAAPRQTERGGQEKDGSKAGFPGHFRGLTTCSKCVSATAGSRSSRPTPAARAASPTAPRTGRSGCSRSPGSWPAPARSSASGTGSSS